jgi:hypothetical protein
MDITVFFDVTRCSSVDIWAYRRFGVTSSKSKQSKKLAEVGSRLCLYEQYRLLGYDAV